MATIYLPATIKGQSSESMGINNFSPRAGATAAYFLCLLLVLVYVNMFPIWKYLSTILKDIFFVILPPVILGLFIGGVLWLRLKIRQTSRSLDKTSIGIGILICCIGLLSTDPDFPIKRVHVFEYAFLCLVARYAMSHFLDGLPLLFFSACFGALLGIHDEFLQGLHPARTYGLRDMGVNMLGSFGGGLIWHGLHLFSLERPSTVDRADVYFLGWLLVAVLLLVWPVVYYRGLVIEIWVALPLLAAPAYYFIYRESFSKKLSHGISAVTAAAVSLVIYPFLTKLPGIVFY